MKMLVSLILLVLLVGCGPDPETVHEEHQHRESPEGRVVLSTEQKQQLELELAEVSRTQSRSEESRPGRVEADPDQQVVLSSQVAGTLSAIDSKVGDRVEAGQLVAVVVSPQVTSLQAEYHEAEVEADLAAKELENKRRLLEIGDDTRRPIETARLELAKAQADKEAAAARLKSSVLKNQRLEKLLEDGIASRQQVEQSRAERQALQAELAQTTAALEIAGAHLRREQQVAKTQLRSKAETFPAEARLARASEQMRHARERLEQLGASPHAHDGKVRLVSPIKGVLVERSLNPGELVAPGAPVASIVDASKIWVWLHLQRSDLQRISPGTAVELSLVQENRVAIRGTIDYLAPRVDEKSQTVPARVVLSNPPPEFRLGSFVEARIPTAPDQKVATLPRSAIQLVEGQTVVYVVEGEGFRRTPVELGPEMESDRVVVKNLKFGTSVAARGAEQLKSLDLAGTIGGHQH